MKVTHSNKNPALRKADDILVWIRIAYITMIYHGESLSIFTVKKTPNMDITLDNKKWPIAY